MRNTIPNIIFSALLAAITLTESNALAESVDIKRIGQHRYWNAYVSGSGDEKVCYIASEPTKQQGDYEERDRVYAMVAHRPGRNELDVVSFIFGYLHKEDAKVSVTIDGDAFELFGYKDTAWSLTDEDDRKLIQRMIRGQRMTVEGVSSDGIETTDTYFLYGFTAAYEDIGEACGR